MTGCSRYSNDVTTPKLPPPPRSAQKRSGLSFALALRNSPSAVTTSAEIRLSTVEPVLAHQPPEAAAQREAGDARVRDGAARRREAVRLGLVIELAPEHAALRDDRARVRIDADALHRRQIDHEAAVVRAVPGRAVAAAANGDEEPV